MTYTEAEQSSSITDLDDLGARIPFGPRPNESIPPSWAARMITLLRERDPSLFVALMGEAATGYRTERAARGRRKEGSQ